MIRRLFLSVACLIALASCGRFAREQRQLNVLLITLDTMRADRLGAYGHAKASTPAIDRLAREGILFRDAVAAVPLTLPSHATILSGALPPRHGLHNNGAGTFPADRATLATLLSQKGYRTGAFVGAFVLDHRFGLSRGFDVYDDEIERDPDGNAELEAERSGSIVVDRALAWLGRSDTRPFFAWVHLFDAHAPYAPPPPFDKNPDPYDGEIAFVDAQVARLIALLESKQLRRDTLIIITGDHGEALGEHGEATHGLLLYEPTLKVPLILSAPGLLEPRSVQTPIAIADLPATIASFAGASFAAGTIDGRNLRNDLEKGKDPAPSDLYAETRYPELFGWSALSAVRRGGFKFIRSSKPELYDLSRDPGEQVNVLTDQRRKLRELSAALDVLRGPARTAAPAAMDEETRAKLASLGYVGGIATLGSKPEAELPSPTEMAPLFARFESATKALQSGRIDEAEREYAKLVAEDPDNPVFRSSLARVARRQKNFDRAIALYRDAVAATPDDPEAWYNLATTLGEAGRVKESTEAIIEAIRRDPKRPEAHNALGIAYSLEGKLDSALAEFRKALEIDPRNARACNNAGNVLREMRRYEEARAAYLKAIALAPRYADPLNGLGVLEVQLDRPAAALPIFDRALLLAPNYHEVLLNRAIALEMTGDRGGAASAYRKFITATAGDPQFTQQRRAAAQLLAQLSKS